jgi:hypothetical protein
VNRSQKLIMLATVTIFGGCVLPIPSRTILRDGVSGRVIDSRTSKPVAGASVTIRFAARHQTGTSRETTRTDEDGGFSVPQQFQQHWGYLLCPGLSYPLPYPQQLGGPLTPKEIAITHRSYRPLNYSSSWDLPRDFLLAPELTRVYRMVPKP